MIRDKSLFLLNAKVLACAAALMAPLAGASAALAEGGRLTVTGSASIAQGPDVAYVSLGVASRDKTAAQALAQNNAAMSAVMEQLEAAGLSKQDIQTSGFNLGPEWVQPAEGRAEISGYAASNMVTIKIADLDNLGKVIDAVVKDGANQLNGITFDLQNPKPVKDEARKAAISEARARAELMADAAGVKLGKIINISEDSYMGGRPELRMAMPAADQGVPISQGEVSVDASVTIIYEIN